LKKYWQVLKELTATRYTHVFRLHIIIQVFDYTLDWKTKSFL
jgi:hypothetical protein